jgi:hypothetical protein
VLDNAFDLIEGHPPQALITIARQEKPPLRFIAGADAVETAEKVAAKLQQQSDAYRELSSSLAYS